MMTTRKRPLKRPEIQASLVSLTTDFPPILSPALLGKLIGVSTKTIYDWIAKGVSTALSASAASTS
jgi:hypothetical protein